MAPNRWYEHAASMFEPDACAATPVIFAPTSLRGYDVVAERDGIGLAVNPWWPGRVTVGIKVLWRNEEVVAGFCEVRTLTIESWERFHRAWFSLAAELSRARKSGWFVVPTRPEQCDDDGLGVSVVHPLTGRSALTLVQHSRQYFHTRAAASVALSAERVRRLERLPTEGALMAKEVLTVARQRGQEWFEPTCRPSGPERPAGLIEASFNASDNPIPDGAERVSDETRIVGKRIIESTEETP